VETGWIGTATPTSIRPRRVRVTITRPADECPSAVRKRIVQSTRRDERRAHDRAGSTAVLRHHGVAAHVSRAASTAADRARVFVSATAFDASADTASTAAANVADRTIDGLGSGVLRTRFSVNGSHPEWADNLGRANDGGDP
jgi:hypothetical protein